MEELRNLALQLGKMGLLKVTLEADLNEFFALKKSANDNFNQSSNRSISTYEDVSDNLEFFVQIYGVKMLIKCRNAKLKTIGNT